MGATLDDVIDDYMVTYYNYYGVEEGTEKYDAIVKNNLIKVLGTTLRVDDVYKADLASEAEAYLTQDAGLTADEVTALKGRLAISLQEIYDASLTEALLKNHEGVYIRNENDGELWRETYLTKDYAYDYIPDEEMPFAKFITDDACYYVDGGNRLLYLFITPDGVGDFAGERAEAYGAVILSEDILDEIIENVEIKDGRITVTTSLSGKSLEIWAEYGVTAGRFEYVLDAKTRELISVVSDYTYDDGAVFRVEVEVTFDAEAPELLKTLIEYANQTENLRNVTVVNNPGTEKEVSQSFGIPKGLIVGFSFGDDYADKVEFYTDAACTAAFDPYADTESDLTVYVKWAE
jgi:hypothetical protein